MGITCRKLCVISLANPNVQVHRWWDITEFYLQQSADDFDTAFQKVDHFLQQAVKRRVESSDLEVGSFLSGGIDSGLVTAIAKNYNKTLKHLPSLLKVNMMKRRWQNW